MTSAPSDIGSSSHGKLKADQWHALRMSYLLLSLICLWGLGDNGSPHSAQCLEILSEWVIYSYLWSACGVWEIMVPLTLPGVLKFRMCPCPWYLWSSLLHYGVYVVLFLKQITTWVSLEIDYEKKFQGGLRLFQLFWNILILISGLI